MNTKRLVFINLNFMVSMNLWNFPNLSFANCKVSLISSNSIYLFYITIKCSVNTF